MSNLLIKSLIFMLFSFLISCADTKKNSEQSDETVKANRHAEPGSQNQANPSANPDAPVENRNPSSPLPHSPNDNQPTPPNQPHTNLRPRDENNAPKNIVESFKSVGIKVPKELEQEFIILDSSKDELAHLAEQKEANLDKNVSAWEVRDLLDMAKIRTVEGNSEKARTAINIACKKDSSAVIDYFKAMNKKRALMLKNAPDIDKADSTNVEQHKKYSSLSLNFASNIGSMKGVATLSCNNFVID